jgi:hypothetical protein
MSDNVGRDVKLKQETRWNCELQNRIESFEVPMKLGKKCLKLDQKTSESNNMKRRVKMDEMTQQSNVKIFIHGHFFTGATNQGWQRKASMVSSFHSMIG